MKAYSLVALLALPALGAAGSAPLHPSPSSPGCGIDPRPLLIAAGSVPLGEDGDGHPGRDTYVAGFRMDRTEVTNAEFAAFVDATGYVTETERQGNGAVFVQPDKAHFVPDNPASWWKLVEGASWRRPEGPGSTIDGKENMPVVQVTFADARAYAKWRDGSLPTEKQWERAARGTTSGPKEAAEWTTTADGKPAANIWNGVFPLINTGEDGFKGLAPVGCFAPNGLGLYDMIGNAWEWTQASDGGPGPLRGGSYLCAGNYCANYRPMGRQVQDRDLATSHAGFRLVYPL